jgi:hypothetical protein
MHQLIVLARSLHFWLPVEIPSAVEHMRGVSKKRAKQGLHPT